MFNVPDAAGRGAPLGFVASRSEFVIQTAVKASLWTSAKELRLVEEVKPRRLLSPSPSAFQPVWKKHSLADGHCGFGWKSGESYVVCRTSHTAPLVPNVTSCRPSTICYRYRWSMWKWCWLNRSYQAKKVCFVVSLEGNKWLWVSGIRLMISCND